ncbi:hypothetical protein ACHAW6_000268 [Cyclotella cf. meneghiniana]
MYGLPQADLLAIELLEQCLNKHGDMHSKLVHGLWKHLCRPIQFILCIDSFSMKYIGCKHALTPATGKLYLGIHLHWDYTKHQVHLHLPGYINKALLQIQHKLSKSQHQPLLHTPIKYGATKQYATTPSTSPHVKAKTKKFIQ